MTGPGTFTKLLVWLRDIGGAPPPDRPGEMPEGEALDWQPVEAPPADLSALDAELTRLRGGHAEGMGRGVSKTVG